MKTLHLIGSAEMGGAERWFARFLGAMTRRQEKVEAVVRTGSALARRHLTGVPFYELPLRTVWDPLSRVEVSRLIAGSDARIVQTYMGRATRLTHIRPGRGRVHVARLGGYYRLDPFRHAHAWIGNTRGLCDWMVKGGLPASRVFHITNFAEPVKASGAAERIALREQIGLSDSDCMMVTAGRLVEVKGHRFLIDALRRARAEVAGRRVRLVILGDGERLLPLQRQAAEAGVAGRIYWAGWEHDPAPWYQAADLVVFPSRDEETLGNVILEAWSHGKPLLTTAFRGAREIVRHGEDAWVVPCDDSAALAVGIEQLLRDGGLRQRLVQAGLVRVQKDFSEASVIDQYRALYAGLTGAD
ncbi:MAG: glycosyltransferase [Azoarcus sp.]|nr:MAG: glycosyltransferase [Azoarcus sp.]